MRKKVLTLLFIGLVATTFVQAQVVDKDAFFTKLEEKHSEFNEINGQFEISMKLFGTDMVIPVNFWQKNKKVRMDFKITMAGMPFPMEQTMLIDENRLVQYHSMLNTVMTADLTKMPDKIREAINRNHISMLGGKENISALNKIKDEIEIVEKKKDGKRYYVLTLKDMGKIGGAPPIMGQLNPTKLFKEMVCWIDADTFLYSKIEIYSDKPETSCLVVDIIKLDSAKVSDDIFMVNFPEDAKQKDITEIMMKLFEFKKKKE
jgi:outer membrane lipoprotein-sorting protein